MEEPRIDRETAEQEFYRFAELAKINLARYEQDDSKEGFADLKETFIQCVMRGTINVDAEGWPTILVDDEDVKQVSIRRRPLSSDGWAADKTSKPFEFKRKETAILASWCNVPLVRMGKIEEAEVRRIQVVYELFRDYRD